MDSPNCDGDQGGGSRDCVTKRILYRDRGRSRYRASCRGVSRLQVNTTFVAVAAPPALMLNALLVAPVSPAAEAVSVYAVPIWSRLRSVKVAVPELAFLVVVPLRVPPPGLVAIPIVMDALEEVTVLPLASCTVIVSGPGMELPAVAFPGWVVNTTIVRDLC